MSQDKKNRKQLLEEIAGLQSQLAKIKEAQAKYKLINEERLQGILDSITDHMSMVDEHYNIVWSNDIAKRLFGEDIIGKKCYTAYHRRDKICRSCPIKKTFSDGKIHEHETEVVDTDGNNLFFWCVASVAERYEDGRVKQVVEISRNITEQKKSEKALQDQRDFENLITSISTNFINLSFEETDAGIRKSLRKLGEFVDVDRSYIFQISDDGAKMSNTFEWCADAIEPQIDNLQNISQGDFPWWTNKLGNFQVIHIPDVEHMPEEAKNEKNLLRAQSIKSLIVVPMIYNRQLVGFMGFDSVYRKREWNRDSITLLKILSEIFVNTLMRKNAELNLRQSENKYRQLFDLNPLGIATYDRQGRYLAANRAYCRIFKWPLEKLLGKNFIDVQVPQEYRRDKKNFFDNLLNKHSFIEPFEAVNVRKDGELITVRYYIDYLHDKNNKVVGLIACAEEITELKRAQEELDEYHEKMFRAEQLASLGMISATIAHELNQPLTVIQLFLQQALRGIKQATPDAGHIADNISDSLSEVSKAVAIVERFRKFARKSSPVEISRTDIAQIAKNITNALTESVQRAKLNLTLKIENSPLYIHGNSVEFEQMFFVLIENAIHAADGKEWRNLNITASSLDGRIHLVFADTCGGIEPENVDRIFEPFFTTKATEIGTGLGLCILERIVKRYNGSIKIENQYGHGTSFYITLATHD